jgi:hypothetical protein
MDAMHAVIEQTKQHLTAAVERYPHTTEEVRSALDAMASQQRAFQVAVTKAAQEDAAALRERAALEVSQVRESTASSKSCIPLAPPLPVDVRIWGAAVISELLKCQKCLLAFARTDHRYPCIHPPAHTPPDRGEANHR